MFWAEIWKISEFLFENFQFMVVKFSIYFNRRVFVMIIVAFVWYLYLYFLLYTKQNCFDKVCRNLYKLRRVLGTSDLSEYLSTDY